MRNFEFGSVVKAFVALGLQKKPRWNKAIYLGNNTVEFPNGKIEFLSDSNIKKLSTLEYRDSDWPDRIKFVDRNWEELKEIVICAMKRFFPNKKYSFNEQEKTIECEGFTISSGVKELESFDSFIETPVWELTVEVYSHGSYHEPPSSDVEEISASANSHVIVRQLIQNLWKEEETVYWENIFYDKMAEEFQEWIQFLN